MNELTKTALFVLAAIIAVGGAVIGRPGRVGVEAPDQIGKALFEEFQDPSLAQDLRIATYDEETGEVSEFTVSKKQGEWVIPSHNDYPADATDNLEIAANLFIGLEVINVAGDRPQDHVTYGVVEPSSDSTELGGEGVGKLIGLKDDKGNRLADLIVGKEVQDLEGQRYVRVPGQDRVYTVKIDPSKLSTKFGDWIVQDVMNINSIDIQKMTVRDYLATPLVQGNRLVVNKEPRSQIAVSWNGDNFKWDLDELSEGRNGELKPAALLSNEELDKERLDEMKNALAALKIADVVPKPELLREGLREGETEIFNDQRGVKSLLECGFYPDVTSDGKLELVSSDGEVTLITKDGIDVTLRFGEKAGGGGDVETMDRFVMITAKVDDASFPQPELEEMPGDAAAESSGDDQQSDSSAEPSEETDADGGESKPSVEDERDRIAKANQRKLDAYNEKRKTAKEKVSELNLRFADWYYVISDDVFKDVRLSKSDVVKIKPGSATEGAGIDSFRQLESEGLKPQEKPAAPAGV